MMNDDSIQLERYISLVAEGDEAALAEVFSTFRPRLKKMVALRLDPRLQARVDPSDVLQETFIDVARRATKYAGRSDYPFFLWLRQVTGQKLLEITRRHLGTRMRDANLELSLHSGHLPQASSVSLAAHLLGRLTSVSRAAVRAEMQSQLQDVLNHMDEIDREILALRHFEELTNNETAAVLGLSKSAASNRYVRALKRLRDELGKIPGFLE
jgi:RNA polymerase sigma-70 factor (ECF subfamily)